MNIEDVLKKYSAYKINIEGKSQKTIDDYFERLKKFINYFDIATVEDLTSKTHKDIQDFIIYLAENKAVETTRNAYLTAIKEIYKYINFELGKNIDSKILYIPMAKVPKRESKYIDAEYKYDFISSITNLRTKTGAAIIFSSGVRCSELMQITCSDIEKGYKDIIGKGNKERRIWFSPDVVKIALEYINSDSIRVSGRKAIIKESGVETDLLFLNNLGKPLSEGLFNKSLKVYGKKFNKSPKGKGKLDWYKELSPHKIRHSFATEKLQKGADIATVRDAMGHSDISTTNRYVHSNRDKVKEIMLEGKEETEENANIMEGAELLLLKMAENKKYFDEIQKVMSEMEKANIWETQE